MEGKRGQRKEKLRGERNRDREGKEREKENKGDGKAKETKNSQKRGKDFRQTLLCGQHLRRRRDDEKDRAMRKPSFSRRSFVPRENVRSGPHLCIFIAEIRQGFCYDKRTGV